MVCEVCICINLVENSVDYVFIMGGEVVLGMFNFMYVGLVCLYDEDNGICYCCKFQCYGCVFECWDIYDYLVGYFVQVVYLVS